MKKILRRSFLHLFAVTVTAGFLVLGSGCSGYQEPDWSEEDVPSIYIEAAASTPAGAKGRVVMPASGLQFDVISNPLVPGGNFLDFEAVSVDAPDGGRTVALLARLDERGARAVKLQSMQARGQRLFLVVQNQPVGAVQISPTMNPQDVYFHAEIPAKDEVERGEKIDELRSKVRATILKIREHKEATK